MANIFVNLPLPVGNGPGTAVDTSGMGRDRTLLVDGTFPGALIAVEISNDGGANFSPVATFQTGPKKLVIPIAGQWMRASVSGRVTGSLAPFVASVHVGADDAGGRFAALPMPTTLTGNGVGAAVDVSTFGAFMTFVCAGELGTAAVGIEASDDNIDWAPVCLFAKGGNQSASQTANFLRTVVSGRTAPAPFTATMSVGAVSDDGGGGGGGGNPQRFVYVATGLEGDSFNIPLPAARLNTSYVAQVTGGALAFDLTFRTPTSGYTTTQIHVNASAAVTAGDELIVVVGDLT